MEIGVGHILTIIVVLLSNVASIMYFRGVFSTEIKNNKAEITYLRDNVQYKDNCSMRMDAVDKRVNRLETSANGSLGR